MKSLRHVLLCLVVALLCSGGASAQPSSKVIIAVNTKAGIGYFVDGEGNSLFSAKFEEVEPFYEGLAKVKQNGKYSIINTEGKVIVKECNDDTRWSRVEY